MRRNYEEKLSGEIKTRNYELVYYVSENMGIIGILAYPKMSRYRNKSVFIFRIKGGMKKRKSSNPQGSKLVPLPNIIKIQKRITPFIILVKRPKSLQMSPSKSNFQQMPNLIFNLEIPIFSHNSKFQILAGRLKMIVQYQLIFLFRVKINFFQFMDSQCYLIFFNYLLYC